MDHQHSIAGGEKKMRVCIMHSDVSTTLESSDTAIISLPHPSGRTSSFIFSQQRLLELQTITVEYSSWLIDNSVANPGWMYTATPMDPVFILLPALEVARGRTSERAGYFRSISDILSSANFSASISPKILTLKDLQSNLRHVCDVAEEFEDELLMRLNDDRVIEYLIAKVKRLSNYMIAKSNHVNSTPSKRLKRQRSPGKEDLSFALGIISEYLDTKWTEKLAQYFDISMDLLKDRPNKDLVMIGIGGDNNECGLNSSHEYDLENDSNNNKSKKNESKISQLSLAQRQLLKVDKRGMKPISSFFQKK